MEGSIKEQPVADLRDYLAEERTFLAWIRTGIALMGFGLLVAHFDLSGGEFSARQNASGMNLHELSLWFGTSLVALGVAVNLFSAWRHTRLIGALERGQPIHRTISWARGVWWRYEIIREPTSTTTSQRMDSTNDRRQQGFDGAVDDVYAIARLPETATSWSDKYLTDRESASPSLWGV